MLSIIIPCYNQHDMTEECINAIRENTQDYEIIIVDNGSTPPIRKPFTGDIETTMIRNEKNEGFPVAVNQGIRAAKGDVIVLLNNDVICVPLWAEKLLPHLDTFSIVAPLTNFCAGIQSVQIEPYGNKEELNEAAGHLSEECEGQTTEVNWLIGIIMMFKRSLYDELGPFDESLWPSCGEEIDFCFRARAAGYRIAVVNDVYVHHEGSQTYNALSAAGVIDYREVCKRNDVHLAEKWGADFWDRQIVVDNSIRLNLGCGRYHLPGFINVDQFANVNPDLVCNALDLPYAPGSVDAIYCGHMLEHLTHEEGQRALKYWHGLLRPGGTIAITVPNFDVLAKRHLANPTAESMREFNDQWIYSYVQESLHRYCYNEALLVEIMTGAGFTELERLPIDHPYFVDPVDWQIAYQGVK
ncbi:MAG: glycosyltransferase [Candidatus Omnitrophica bacterium]|jgi:GT2 family glycosyltransferase/predicted SAM-dependent methyltransferase|nr:glycosyltransferase [Candidatus Omnitrophota bacterium]